MYIYHDFLPSLTVYPTPSPYVQGLPTKGLVPKSILLNSISLCKYLLSSSYGPGILLVSGEYYAEQTDIIFLELTLQSQQ